MDRFKGMPLTEAPAIRRAVAPFAPAVHSATPSGPTFLDGRIPPEANMGDMDLDPVDDDDPRTIRR